MASSPPYEEINHRVKADFELEQVVMPVTAYTNSNTIALAGTDEICRQQDSLHEYSSTINKEPSS